MTDIEKTYFFLLRIGLQMQRSAEMPVVVSDKQWQKIYDLSFQQGTGALIWDALIDIDPQKSKEQLLVISNVVRESIKDVRRSLYKLRPGALDQRTLKDGLIKMIEEFQSVSHLNVDLYYEWENVDFENTKEDIIFRIIQETMTNALRHGHASHIEIHLFDEEEKYMIIMQDNGSGCKEIHYGYGLKQMHERVAILNGTIHFYSEEGFRTVVEIPKIGGKKDG